MKPYSNGELAQMEQAGKNAEHCVCCGDIIPEGRQVCPICEKMQFPPDYIDRRKLTAKMRELIPTRLFNEEDMLDLVNEQPRADVVERKKGEWTTHEVACLLAEVIGDNCACNVNGNDEWLPFVCEFAETTCPDVAGVACWEQFLKHRERRKDDE